VIAGVDEAGRGPLAGPVVAAACIVPSDIHFDGIHDSKKLNAKEREHLFDLLTSQPRVIYATAIIDHTVIDDINILQAALRAMADAVKGLTVTPHYVLIDGNRPPTLHGDKPPPGQCIIKGDSKCYSIAAASIIAKVTRDRIMMELDKQYPQYNFGQHKGYGTAAHMAAIAKYGPCPIHRLTFAPLKHQYGPKRKKSTLSNKRKLSKKETHNKAAKKTQKKSKHTEAVLPPEPLITKALPPPLTVSPFFSFSSNDITPARRSKRKMSS